MARVAKQLNSAQFEMELAKDIAEFYDDPVGYVRYAFPWGQGELRDHPGPDSWQEEQLARVGEKIKKDPAATIREAIASGHGIGKTAEVAWLILWAMSTRPHLTGVVTANTMSQLNTKTWRELAVWWKRAINGHWFKWSATKFWHLQHPETWFMSAQPNSEHNSEAFAGLHSRYKLIIYDESSGIPDKIFEVTEGAMTDPCSMWFVFGNPTKNTGRFRDCFQKDAKRWEHHQIDSRTCRMTNKAEIADMVEAYGEDSDFVRVRVRGMFPRLGSFQFISSEIADKAIINDIPYEAHCMQPPVLGVDVARYGDDKTALVVRQGRKALAIRKFRELNTMQVAVEVILVKKEFNCAVIFVDGVGVGAGVVDRLQQLGHEVVEVNVGEKAKYEDEIYYNHRAECWDRMRKWLANGADIPNDPELRQALIGIEYDYDDKERIRMERKKDMKKRGLPSPDEGDALALTFAEELGDLKKQSFEPTEEDAFEPA